MFTNGSERAPDDAPESSTLKRGYHERKIAKLQDSKVAKMHMRVCSGELRRG